MDTATDSKGLAKKQSAPTAKASAKANGTRPPLAPRKKKKGGK